MKKLRIAKTKLYGYKLNEDDNANAGSSNSTLDNTAVEPKVKYIGANGDALDSKYEQQLCKEYAIQLASNTSLFKVKLSSSFLKNVQFPKAPTQLASLMLETFMPQKFQNIYASYDDNPLKTIENNEDLALKYFSVFRGKEKVDKEGAEDSFDDTSYHNDTSEDETTSADASANIPSVVQNNQQQQAQLNTQNNQQLTLGQQLQQTAPQQLAATTNQQTSTVNASAYLPYNYRDELYEDIEPADAVTAAVGGAKIGAEIGKVATVGASALTGGIAGFLTTASPIFAIWYGTGYLLGGHGPDHGEHLYNDSELHKKYSEKVADVKSTLTVIHEAIDNYVNNLLVIIEQGLTHITSGNERLIAEFSDLVTDALSSRSQDSVKVFLESNNKMIEKIKQKLQDRIKKFEAEKRINKAIALKAILDPTALSAQDLAHYYAGNNKAISSEGKAVLNQWKKELSFLKSDTDHDYFEESIVNYNFSNYLNESSEDDKVEKIEFDADSLYTELQRLFRLKMNQILSTDPKKWEVVETARKQMEALRDGASEEIKKSIAIVCRMANSDLLGLTSKLTAFVSKHPMREAKLTNLWKRHENDLNLRIEQRIKQISELDGKGPLKMAKEFYRQTIPNLLAMMVTYKTLLTLFGEAKLKIPGIVLDNATEIEKINEQIKNSKNEVPTLIASAFNLNGQKLNKDGKAVYDMGANQFTKEDLTYLLPFLQGLINSDNFSPVLIKKLISLNEELLKYYQDNKINEFFSRLTDFIIIDCNIIDKEEIARLVTKALGQINAADMNALINMPNIKDVADKPVAKTLLAYILKSDGHFLEQYDINKGSIKLDGTTDNIKNIKAQLHIDNVDIEDIQETANQLFVRSSLYFKNVDPAKTAESIISMVKAYFELHLSDLKAIDMNPYKILGIFVTMCNDANMTKLFGKDAIISEYENLKDLWQSKNTDSKSWNSCIDALSTTAAERHAISSEGLLLKDESQFNLFINIFTIPNNGLDSLNKERFEKLCNDAEYKSITLPGGLNLWDAIAKNIIVNNTFDDLRQLMNIDKFDNVLFGDNAIQMLKQLLLYIIKIAAAKFTKIRDDSAVFEKLWTKACITTGDNTLSLSLIITLLHALIKGMSPNNIKSVNKLINNVDMELYRRLRDKLEPEFFKHMLLDTKDDFKDADDALEYIKKVTTLQGKSLASKDIDPSVFNNYLLDLCEFLQAPDKCPKLRNLYSLASSKKPKDVKNLNNTVKESYFFYGMTMYDMLLESEETMADFLNTPEGEAWLRGLAEDADSTQTDTSANNVSDNNTAVSEENKTAADEINQAIKQLEETLNKR